MKKGQKLTKNGYQLIGFPMEVMNISQGCNGSYSHEGCMALDICGPDAGIDETIAPVDMKLVAHDSSQNGNAVFFESTKEVLFVDGTVDYATMMFIHDNDISDIVAYANSGQTWQQGQSFGDEGTAGNATGNHCHFEIAKGQFSHMYDYNGVRYHLPNSISPDLACVTDGTTIYNNGQPSGSGNTMTWKTSSQVSVSGTSSSSSATEEKTKKVGNLTVTLEDGTATFTTGPINVRKGSPTGQVVAQYTKGQSVKYWGKYVGNGHRYIVYTGASGNTNFVAVSGSESYGVDKWADCQ